MTETEATEPTLDDIVKGFDEKATPKKDDRMENVLNFVEDFQTKEQQKEVNDGINDAVEFIKGDENITASDRLVKGFLNALADENPKVLDAFNNRSSKPDEWEEVKKWAQQEAVKEFSVDPKISADVAAAKAAASGQTVTEPEEKPVTNTDIESMSDIEFRSYKEAMGRGMSHSDALKSVRK